MFDPLCHLYHPLGVLCPHIRVSAILQWKWQHIENVRYLGDAPTSQWCSVRGRERCVSSEGHHLPNPTVVSILETFQAKCHMTQGADAVHQLVEEVQPAIYCTWWYVYPECSLVVFTPANKTSNIYIDVFVPSQYSVPLLVTVLLPWHVSNKAETCLSALKTPFLFFRLIL